MKIWGLSDLHLSFSTDKPMHVFGDNWKNHAEKMAKAWDELVADDDIVLSPGDISWAMRLNEAEKDLAWIGERPGLKILCRGNHDFWWSSISRVRAALPPKCVALQNDAIDIGPFVVAGARLWSAPGAIDYKPQDLKIYERELLRLEMSLKAAQKLAPGKPILAAVHYPPFNGRKEPTGYVELLEKYDVKVCVYGHLHTAPAHRTAVVGERNGIHYHLLACDYIDFKPVQIWPALT